MALWLIVTIVPGFSIRGGFAWSVCAMAVGLSNGLARTAVVFYRMPLRLSAIWGLSLAMNGVVVALLAMFIERVAISGAPAAATGWIFMAGLAVATTLHVGPDGRWVPLIPANPRRAAS